MMRRAAVARNLVRRRQRRSARDVDPFDLLGSDSCDPLALRKNKKKKKFVPNHGRTFRYLRETRIKVVRNSLVVVDRVSRENWNKRCRSAVGVVGCITIYSHLRRNAAQFCPTRRRVSVGGEALRGLAVRLES